MFLTHFVVDGSHYSRKINSSIPVAANHILLKNLPIKRQTIHYIVDTNEEILRKHKICHM